MNFVSFETGQTGIVDTASETLATSIADEKHTPDETMRAALAKSKLHSYMTYWIAFGRLRRTSSSA